MDDDYENYGSEEFDDDSEDDEDSDILWGTYAVVYPTMESEPSGINYEMAFFISINYNASLFYQKEVATGIGAWKKTTLWNAQSDYADALYTFWTNGMLDYLSELREEKEESAKQNNRGIPLTRRKTCERNHTPSL